MEQTIIYAYTQDNNVYVGKTKNPNNRRSKHKTRFGNWEYKILDEIPSFKKEDWKPYECAWIQIYKEWGYNVENRNNGGGGPQGFKTEEEKKQNYRQATRNWNKNNPEKIKEYDKKNYYLTREAKSDYRKQYNKQYYLNKKQNAHPTT